MNKIKLKFQCQQCYKTFEKDFPGPTKCVFCGYEYVDWLNSKKFIEGLGKYRGGPWITLEDFINGS